MARALLTILLALPLLMPPGVCLCDAGARGAKPTADHATKPIKKGCSCCGRHGPPAAAVQPPAAPERHDSDCPAVNSSAWEKWDVSPRAAVEFDSTSVALIFLSTIVAALIAPVADAPPIAFPPAYLTHQSFLN